ncbi:uncharacterized protein HMPREF1541_07549 [Cyphellophora europaea CBS 101466]|uniref:Heterokaryon incompatibility domain-containing protein n=1 Tax=Cyphellophora europaea (strain CBS 101466) TaxID=1220924 RepID=W2RN57_CYPE1|nr:uncharacterized protein HMPREF1541_07549 [Cyphellophora europaea CBS 101466]ETN37926.1 hypothetical protein HMPREF1541_07549 [Cyphellophora europaea CBS 101466]
MASEPQPLFAPDAQPHFTHDPLPDTGTYFRLLALQPGHGSEPLRASLAPVALNSIPRFEALSYMWGPSEPQRTLHVNNQDFLLRPNIHAFLRRLRHASTPRVLWLDAVCIDQNNIRERGDQVSLMRDIYTSCQQCLVWLGESLPRGDEVLEVFAGNPVDEQGMTDLNNLIRLLYRDDLAEPFRVLLSNDYWSRVWMIQETTLPAKVVVHVGGSSCLLDHVPTQVRGRMFDLFQESRVQYQEWLRVFSQPQGWCDEFPMPASILKRLEASTGDEVFPTLVGQDSQAGQHAFLLGFRKSRGRSRWEPVVAELEASSRNDDEPRITFYSNISLSVVSGLSFPTTNFDPSAAFKSIECAFWCIGNTQSEQLLDERRRYSTSNNRQFSSNDFRNYLENASRWHCTDIRDRVFGSLGVFGVWPRAWPFRADYNLPPGDLLLSVVDYCRPTDPFKLGIKLLSALQISSSVSESTPSRKTRDVTLMSRIAWPLTLFNAVPLSNSEGGRYSAVSIRRSDVPAPAQGFVYLIPHDTQPQASDIIASLGDGSVVIGIRASPSDGAERWSCVGIGFDVGSTFEHDDPPEQQVDLLIGIEEATLRELLLDLPRFRMSQAGSQDKTDDGVPALWWITCPSRWFWYFCRREERLKEGIAAADDDLGDVSEADGSMCAVDGGGLSSFQGSGP